MYVRPTRFTNQYVVPYCPQLLLLFDCHLNIEISARLGTVKYLSKYIYKGPDRATMEISSGMQDEIKAHLDGCFIGPTEACWKIFEFNMHGESPAVQRLPIYLPNEHYVNFHAHQTVNEVLARQNMEKTQLLLGLTTTLYMIMVWALPTSSSLSTIPGILKSNHGIQDSRLR